MDTLGNVKSYDLMDFATAWSELGAATQEQVRSVLDDPDAEVNPSALKSAWCKLNRFKNQEINDGLRAAMAMRDYFV